MTDTEKPPSEDELSAWENDAKRCILDEELGMVGGAELLLVTDTLAAMADAATPKAEGEKERR